MDIRNFFGNKKLKTSSSSSPSSTPSNKLKIKEKEEEKEEEKNEIISHKESEKSHEKESLKEIEQEDILISSSSHELSSSHVEKVMISSTITSDLISSQQKISPDLQAIITWKQNEPVPYSAVAAAFDKIASTSSRLEKESTLCKLFRAVIITTPQDLEPVVYLTSNVVYPAYEGLELGIGWFSPNF
jgi:hypothetical protein